MMEFRAAWYFAICHHGGLEFFSECLRRRSPSTIASEIVIDLIDEQVEKHAEGQAKHAEQEHGYFSHCGVPVTFGNGIHLQHSNGRGSLEYREGSIEGGLENGTAFSVVAPMRRP